MTALPKSVEDAIWDAGSGSSPTEEEAEAADAIRKAVAAAIREAENEAIERVARTLEENVRRARRLGEQAGFTPSESGRIKEDHQLAVADCIRSLKHPAPASDKRKAVGCIAEGQSLPCPDMWPESTDDWCEPCLNRVARPAPSPGEGGRR
jgi:hypothetical protein